MPHNKIYGLYLSRWSEGNSVFILIKMYFKKLNINQLEETTINNILIWQSENNLKKNETEQLKEKEIKGKKFYQNRSLDKLSKEKLWENTNFYSYNNKC